MSVLIFDVETSRSPDEELTEFCPAFDGSAFEPVPWNDSMARLGNLKVPEKVRAKIEADRKDYELSQQTLPQRRKDAELVHWEAFTEGAALSAVTGRVLVIGYHNPENDVSLLSHCDGVEREIIESFWYKYSKCRQAGRSMVGLNIYDFDLPFLVRRSWQLDVQVPPTAFEQNRNWVNWDRIFVDIRPIWLLGQRGTGTKSNFDTLAAAFHTGGKPDGVTGADFARLWATNRDAAVAYLEEDIRQPAIWAERMGIE